MNVIWQCIVVLVIVFAIGPLYFIFTNQSQVATRPTKIIMHPNPSVTQPSSLTVGICSIGTKNFLHKARTLFASVRRHNPALQHFFLLLLDRVDGFFEPDNEPFAVIPIAHLRWPSRDILVGMIRRYNAMELSCALKPALVWHLMQNYKMKRIIFMDADVFVVGSLSHAVQLLHSYDLVTTPHCVRVSKVSSAEAIQFLKTGSMNAGFFGISLTGPSMRFLKWWQQMLVSGSRIEIPNMLYYDQKWIDLAPSFVSSYAMRDVAYNVAFWNWFERVDLITFRNSCLDNTKLRGNNNVLTQSDVSSCDIEWLVREGMATDNDDNHMHTTEVGLRPLIFWHMSSYRLERRNELGADTDIREPVELIRTLTEQYASMLEAYMVPPSITSWEYALALPPPGVLLQFWDAHNSTEQAALPVDPFTSNAAEFLRTICRQPLDNDDFKRVALCHP